MAIKNLLPSVWGKKDVPITRREENDPFYALQRNLNQMFESFFEDWGSGWLDRPMTGFMPRVDVRESDKEFAVEAELPGLDQNDIDISLTDNVLTIQGEKKQESETKEGGYYRMERSYGSFRRDIPLPCEVDRDKITANFVKGVLKINVPKSETSLKNVKKIKISSDK